MEWQSLDMSSNKPHISLDCPTCGKFTILLVKDGGKGFLSCCPYMEYEMTELEDESIEIEFTSHFEK